MTGNKELETYYKLRLVKTEILAASIFGMFVLKDV